MSTPLSANQVRQLFLDYFVKQGHVVVPSALLVPENDPTTLFTSSGMQPMIPYLLGETHPLGTRICNSQKCFRAQDIEEVGDNRHTTFFEMLGNWSFGDYFKEEQLTWIFDFLVNEIGLRPDRLFVTVFAGDKMYNLPADQEAVALWQKLFASQGIQAGVSTWDQDANRLAGDNSSPARIMLYPVQKNWWSRSGTPDQMPVGEPGGPDSEIFYDFGGECQLHEKSAFANLPCHLNCDCGRYLEIGNSVFMHLQRTVDDFADLPKRNIDFGGGLERILAASSHQPDVFQTELFLPILYQIESLTHTTYKQYSRPYRIIADHIKASIMLIADGVLPDRKDQGYLVRRLLRRAMRQARFFSSTENLLPKLVDSVVKIYHQSYPELGSAQTKIEEVIAQESSKFERTLNAGLREFHKLVTRHQVLTGELAYHLYETYGFPLEILLDEAQVNQVPLADNLTDSFCQTQQLRLKQSQAGLDQKFKGGLADHSARTTAYHTATHLIHQALRRVLGEHIAQKGSNITPERLRFDFSHPQPLTTEQLAQVEKQVNNWIEQSLPVTKITLEKTEALKSGALAFFAERYPNQVNVYVIGRRKNQQLSKTNLANDPDIISMELCGGPHVTNTKEIGKLSLYKEKSASAGVRRIYAKIV